MASSRIASIVSRSYRPRSACRRNSTRPGAAGLVSSMHPTLAPASHGYAAGMDLSGLADEPFCYVTTTGRVTGQPHTIEIWFAVRNRTLYLLAGGGHRADWV